MGNRENTSRIRTLNPFTEEVVKSFDELSPRGVDEKIRQAQGAFGSYRKTSFSQRSGWLQKTSSILESRKGELAKIMTVEMGKPLRASMQEVEKCAAGCRYYAETAARFMADEEVK